MQFTNLSDWSWAYPDMTPIADVTNNLTLGNKYVYNPLDKSTFQIDLSNGQQNATYMTFGIEYSEKSAYFGNLTNDTIQPNISFSSIKPGIVMSDTLYRNWLEMVDVIADGAETYTIENRTSVFLSQGCAHYNDTLMQYSFRFNVAHAEDQYNVTVPLAAFAVDRSNLTCELFVSSDNFTISGETFYNNVQFGSMFFQSFWGMSQTSEAMALRVNEFSNNTMFGGQITNNTNQTNATNPFIVYPVHLPNAKFTSKGLQTYNATISGISDSK